MTVSKTINKKPGSNLQPVECHLLIPSIQVYCMTDTIPFHAQLSGPIESLRDLIGSGAPGSTGSPKPVVRVALVRQVGVKIGETQGCKNMILDEAVLDSLPPPIYPSPDAFPVMDWRGSLRSKNVTVGSFSTHSLAIKVSMTHSDPMTLTTFQDLIVLSMTPCSPEHSSFVRTQHLHPIRLVTHPCMDQTE